MAINPEISLGVYKQEGFNPIQTLGQVMQLRAMQQAAETHDIENQIRVRDLKDQQELESALKMWSAARNAPEAPAAPEGPTLGGAMNAAGGRDMAGGYMQAPGQAKGDVVKINPSGSGAAPPMAQARLRPEDIETKLSPRVAMKFRSIYQGQREADAKQMQSDLKNAADATERLSGIALSIDTAPALEKAGRYQQMLPQIKKWGAVLGPEYVAAIPESLPSDPNWLKTQTTGTKALTEHMTQLVKSQELVDNAIKSKKGMTEAVGGLLANAHNEQEHQAYLDYAFAQGMDPAVLATFPQRWSKDSQAVSLRLGQTPAQQASDTRAGQTLAEQRRYHDQVEARAGRQEGVDRRAENRIKASAAARKAADLNALEKEFRTPKMIDGVQQPPMGAETLKNEKLRIQNAYLEQIGEELVTDLSPGWDRVEPVAAHAPAANTLGAAASGAPALPPSPARPASEPLPATASSKGKGKAGVGDIKWYQGRQYRIVRMNGDKAELEPLTGAR